MKYHNKYNLSTNIVSKSLNKLVQLSAMENKKLISLSIIITVLAIMVISYSKLIINITPSLPYGIYIKSKDKIIVGDYVSFCLNDEYRSLGLARNYLEPGKACNGSTALIKKVIALPYDKITLGESQIIVSGKTLNYSTAHFDSQHRKLESYPHGTYTENCYWLIGDYDISHSWDSRYWGCIPPKQIITKIKPLFTWE